jgi:hypothetical protein
MSERPGKSGRYVLKLSLQEFKPVPEEFREKFGIIFVHPHAGDDANFIILIGGILEIMEGGGTVKITKLHHTGYDMFGGCDIEWEITCGGASAYRRKNERISDSWQRVETYADEFSVTGLPYTAGLEWNGEHGYSFFACELTIHGITPDEDVLISKLAGMLYNKVGIERKNGAGVRLTGSIPPAGGSADTG